MLVPTQFRLQSLGYHEDLISLLMTDLQLKRKRKDLLNTELNMEWLLHPNMFALNRDD